MAKFDLELLLIFDEYKARNVTRAADNLGLPQSTVSIALGKLRQHFGDRLFSRTTKGMEPTPRAQNAIADVRMSIAALQQALASQPVFEPGVSQREFRICMTDISEVVLLPTLLNHLKQIGPGIRVDVSKISPDTPMELQDGTVDLAVGFMPHLDAGFYQQKLFLGVARIVAQTDYIVTVPQRYGVAMTDREFIKLLAPPVSLPNFSVKQHWHERFHEVASNRWLRQTMSSLFMNSPMQPA